MTSLPTKFCERIKIQFPTEADALIESLEWPVKTSVHIHPKKSPELWLNESHVKWYSSGRFLTERPTFTLDPLLHAGCYYPQESSSMILHHVLSEIFEKDDHKTFLDLCASPGGKTLVLSDFAGEEGRVISNELNRSRNQILKENVVKWGAQNVIVTCNESGNFSELSAFFDGILVDAPCSGEGMFRKDSNARSEWSENNVAQCSIRQKEIISNVLPSLKAGGYLIYSTCTFAPEENEMNCTWLMETGELESVPIAVDEKWNIDNVSGDGFRALRFLPHKVDGEGFFIAVFRKRAEQVATRLRPKIIFEQVNKKETLIVEKWSSGTLNLCKGPDQNIYASPFTTLELNELAQELYITMPGVELGRIIREDFIPAHALALSGLYDRDLPSVELNREDALSYLRGESTMSFEGIGWHLANFDGHPLGWIKLLKNRMNNYYPKEWRIRMR